MEELKKRQALSRSNRLDARLATFGPLAFVALVATNAQAQECVPPCRDGYVCVQGECVEACNPPCPEGEECVGAGKCEPKASVEPTYASVNTGAGGAVVDTGGKPSIALPATFVGLGGFFLIAGGVTFGTSEWDGYYGEYWGTGQWVGVGLMTMGAIMVATATPFLAIRAKERRDWDRQHAGIWSDRLAISPVVTPTARNRVYGLTLRGRF